MREKIGSFFVDDIFSNKEIVKKYERQARMLLEDERISAIIVGHDSFYNFPTVSIYTHRCELFRSPKELNEDLSNFEEVFKNIFGLWRTLPEEHYWKEQASGTFRGKKIKFNRIFSSYRFSDEEVEQLLNEESIVIEDEKGQIFKGKLEEQEYHGFRYFGFKILPSVPRKLWGVTFTDEQMNRLNNGESINVYGFYSSKKGTFYNAEIYFDEERGIQVHQFLR